MTATITSRISRDRMSNYFLPFAHSLQVLIGNNCFSIAQYSKSRRSFYKLRVDQFVQFCHTVARNFCSSATMAPKKRMSGGQVKVTTKALKNIETNSRVNALGKIMSKTGVMLLIFQSPFYMYFYISWMYTSEHDSIPTWFNSDRFIPNLRNLFLQDSLLIFFQRYNNQLEKAFFQIVWRTAKAIDRQGHQVGMASNPGRRKWTQSKGQGFLQERRSLDKTSSHDYALLRWFSKLIA